MDMMVPSPCMVSLRLFDERMNALLDPSDFISPGVECGVESASVSLGVSTCHVYSGDRCLVASVVTPAFSQ